MATVLAPPRSAKSGKGMGGTEGGAGGGGQQKSGDGKDDPEVAAFTGDFIDGHGGALLQRLDSDIEE